MFIGYPQATLFTGSSRHQNGCVDDARGMQEHDQDEPWPLSPEKVWFTSSDLEDSEKSQTLESLVAATLFGKCASFQVQINN